MSATTAHSTTIPGAAPRTEPAAGAFGAASCVITAWSAVSPFGIGRAAFTAGLGEPPSEPSVVDPQTWGGADDHARLVPGFTPREALGAKGTRSMDRATGLAVATVGQVLDETDGRGRATGDQAALVLGTTTGSAQSMMNFTRDSLTGKRPYFVDPARFPNTVMNCAAGQCAIWHDLRGPNATVAGGRLAGLHALNYGRRLLASGRARTVMCGAVEEFSAARSWLRHAVASGGLAPDAVASGAVASGDGLLGEGCVVLQVESRPPGSGALAEVLAVEFATFLDDAKLALGRCLERALERSGTGAADLWCVASDPAAPGLHRDVVTALLGPLDHVVRPELSGLGDTGAVTSAFQIAAVLASAEGDPAACGRTALVTCVSDEGVAGAAVLRLC